MPINLITRLGRASHLLRFLRTTLRYLLFYFRYAAPALLKGAFRELQGLHICSCIFVWVEIEEGERERERCRAYTRCTVPETDCGNEKGKKLNIIMNWEK